jgi:hypothetical protein
MTNTSGYEYYGLEGVEYSSAQAAPYKILWTLEPVDGVENGFYIKSADGAGMPTFKKYKLTDFEDADNAPKTPDKHECKCGDKFVLKKDFQALQSEFEALREELEELKAKPKAKTAKKAVEEVTDGE